MIFTVFITKHLSGTFSPGISTIVKPKYSVFAQTKNNVFKWNSSTRRKHFICPCFVGRFGNQMFLFASSFGIAKSKGLDVLINANCILLKAFDLKVEIREDTSICSSEKTKIIQETHPAMFDKNILKFDNKSDVNLKGFLQSYLYFEAYEKELRQQFIFKESVRNRAIQLLEIYLQRFGIFRHFENKTETLRKNMYRRNLRNKVTLIGVHIRRGDFSTINQSHGINVATKAYLQKAVNLYLSKYKDLIFVVASDGIKWAKENMPQDIKVLYLEGHPQWLDMAIVTQTEHFISTVGTFSWWAGWLTGGNVTYYRWPAKEGTVYRRQFSKDYKDFYYKKWYSL